MKRKLLTLGLGLLCLTGLCGCGQKVVYVTQEEYDTAVATSEDIRGITTE